MSLLNVQADPIYRALIDEVLDGVRPIVEAKDPSMCYRAGWIFVTSPGAITPFHIDHEHNFIVQIRGRKRLYVWDHLDRSVVSERAQELFHDEHSRELVQWHEDHRAKARIFDLLPGMGGYIAVDLAAPGRERRWPVDHHELHLLHGRDATPRDAVSRQRPLAPARHEPAGGR